MGTLFGFVVGYVIGARAGSRDFEEVVAAVRAVRSSDEFQALIDIAKTHARGTAAVVGQWLAEADTKPAADMVARARERARQG